jgi:hypothetical protein
LQLKYTRHPTQKSQIKNALIELCFIKAFHNFLSVFRHGGWEVGVLMLSFMTVSDLKNVEAHMNYNATPKVLIFVNLRALKPASKSVTIDFGNERHCKPGDVVCPWGRGNEQKQ